MNESSNKYAVAYASNERGVFPLCSSIWSLVENAAPQTTYDICVLSDGIVPESRQKIQQMVAKANNRHTVRFIDVTNTITQDVAVCDDWPKVAWARVFLAKLLPEIDRVLYLDIDTLVCDDLTSLFTLDMGDAALGVVLEYESHEGSHFNERLHIPLNCIGYFNSGVLLMNLKAFRKDNLVEHVMNYAGQYKDALKCPDQDALNGALCDRLIQLHPRWNWQDGLTRRIIKANPNARLWHGNSPKTSIEAALWPGILHYQGTHKPWRYNHRIEGPRYEASMRRAGLVEKDAKMPGFNWGDCVKKFLYAPMYAMTWRRIHQLAKKYGAQKPE